MKPEAYVGAGSFRRLEGVLTRYGARSVFLVTGDRSYALSGAEGLLEPYLKGREVHRFHEFSTNPKLEDVRTGVECLRKAGGDVVLAVGGGSVLDMAKLVNVYAREGVDGPVTPGKPLIAVPTTSGTGSEATQFATVYIDGEKHSISGNALLPDVAIVDPDLTRSMPAGVAASSGIDALSQAIESYWCVNSTDESKRFAAEAIHLILPNLRGTIRSPTEASRLAMAKGAHLAGQAINITRTTAPHAFSYPLTSRFGVPHGHAVGLTLPGMLELNHETSDEDTVDPRGAAYVRHAIEEICDSLDAPTVTEASGMLRKLMQDIGLATSFEGLGIDREKAIDAVVREVNAERLANNPRRITEAQLIALLNGI